MKSLLRGVRPHERVVELAVDLKARLGGLPEMIEVLFQRWRERVEPVNGAEVIFHRSRRFDFFNAQRKYRPSFRDGALDFPMNLMGNIGVGGKYEHHDPAIIYGVDD